MNIEKYTDRARGFVQSAQSLALREGHQQFAPEHLLKVLLDDPEGLGGGLIDRSGGNSREALTRRRGGAGQAAEGGGRRGRAALPRAGARARVRCGREEPARRRATASSPSSGCCSRSRSRRTARPARSLAQAPASRRRTSTPRSRRCARAARRIRRSAENAYDALKKYARDLTQAARDGKLDPGDRPRRGNPPHHPGAVAPHQEQSGADRRAGRRQDRDRRGPRAAHRQRRRAGEPEGQEAARARHGRADRRREISRRVRGAAEGRAERGHVLGRRHHPVHRRDAHAGRRRQGRRRDGRVEPAKPALARGELHCIGATTLDEYRKHVEKDAALARRFQPVFVAEPTRGGHGLDPARPEGQVRAAPRRAHHRRRDRRGRDAVEPLHHRPLPARQGDRPGRRGGGAAADAGRFQARGARLDRPRGRAAEDRAGGAEEGDRRRARRSG